jgi:hypothetical protein
MLAVASRGIQLGMLLVTALAVSISPAAGQTYTPEQEQACTGDAFRLCSSEIPDVGRVTACMVAKQDQEAGETGDLTAPPPFQGPLSRQSDA